MPILYTDGDSGSADAKGAAGASGVTRLPFRDDCPSSEKKRRKKSVIGRFGRAVAKSFKTNDKGSSRHRDVELANEKLRQINRADEFRKTTRTSTAITKRSAPTLGERHRDLAGRFSEGGKSNSECTKEVLRYREVSPVVTRHPHGITVVAGVRTRGHSEPKNFQEDSGSLSMHLHHSEGPRMNVAILRQEVEESFAVIEAESPVPSSSMSTANISMSNEDLASLGAQQSGTPAVLECGQMQEIKLHKSAGGDDCIQQRSVSKNTTLPDLRTASVMAAISAEHCARAAIQLQDAAVQTELSLRDPKNPLFCQALRNFFAALRDFLLCSACAHREATNE
ncbi:uncharacterized protein LOC8038741 [Ixodes scapularis]|uniref:uncharacterized protein LOC8038741 n=1 Tax=Ixodes scapularis TaxID=6945 RepID=UPI001A9CDD04|nr:uncharacterized protein LOC8038741 [Ixodes scapularis]